MPLFEGLGVQLVLSGHTHLYERSVKDGVNYLVGGPAGGPLGIFGGKNPHMVRAVSKATVTHFETDDRELRIRTEDLRGRAPREIYIEDSLVFGSD